jgi:hypothetical protein
LKAGGGSFFEGRVTGQYALERYTLLRDSIDKWDLIKQKNFCNRRNGL